VDTLPRAGIVEPLELTLGLGLTLPRAGIVEPLELTVILGLTLGDTLPRAGIVEPLELTLGLGLTLPRAGIVEPLELTVILGLTLPRAGIVEVTVILEDTLPRAGALELRLGLTLPRADRLRPATPEKLEGDTVMLGLSDCDTDVATEVLIALELLTEGFAPVCKRRAWRSYVPITSCEYSLHTNVISFIHIIDSPGKLHS